MNVLVLACLTEGTGNAVTARRIATHLASAHRVTLVDTCDARLSDLRRRVRRERIEYVVAVHALLAGPFARRLDVPYALVLGGTDLYADTHPMHERAMRDAVSAATALITFSRANAERAAQRWPATRARMHVVPQAVDVSDASEFSIRAALGLDASARLFVLAAGIRAVKDPAFLAEAFAAWRAPNTFLVVVGPVLDESYAPACLARLDAADGVTYLPALSRPDLLAALRDADVALNTSGSEGMCGVLLEAMRLGTPVFARRNAGNAALIDDGVDGVLFDTPEDFVAAVDAWSQDGGSRDSGSRESSSRAGALARLSRRAAARVRRAHCPEREREAYLSLASPERVARAA